MGTKTRTLNENNKPSQANLQQYAQNRQQEIVDGVWGNETRKNAKTTQNRRREIVEGVWGKENTKPQTTQQKTTPPLSLKF